MAVAGKNGTGKRRKQITSWFGMRHSCGVVCATVVTRLHKIRTYTLHVYRYRYVQMYMSEQIDGILLAYESHSIACGG